MKNKGHTKQVISAAIVIIILLIISGATWFIYKNRCHFVACAYASWEGIQDILFSRTNDGRRIEFVRAFPSKWNSYSNSGPAFIEIEVLYSYVDPEMPEGGNLPYRMETYRFDDQTLLKYREGGDFWSNYRSSQKGQEILKRVKVHPREAFSVTWELAKHELSLDSQNLSVYALLVLYDEEEEFIDGHGSIWHVSYEGGLVYYVDARTGNIVYTHRPP